MAEFSGVAQTVNPGESIVFSIVNVPCTRGLINHDPGTGNFLLAGKLQNGPYSQGGCRCNSKRMSLYTVAFGANVAIPTEGGTLGEISLAIVVDGGTLTNTVMRSNPSALGDLNYVGRTTNVPIFNGCCQTVTVRNTSSTPITVSEPNIVFSAG
jgi:hypothetical protein